MDGLTKEKLTVLGTNAAEAALGGGEEERVLHEARNEKRRRKGQKDAPYKADFDLLGDSGRTWGR